MIPFSEGRRGLAAIGGTREEIAMTDERRLVSREDILREFDGSVCPACHHRVHDPGGCSDCPRCELHTDEAAAFVLRYEPELLVAFPQPATEPALDVERLARAMHPVWMEDVPERPDTMTAHDWGQLVLNMSLRRTQALQEARDVLDRLAAQPSAEVERLRAPLAEFTDANAATMLARLHHGASKFGETSWRDGSYSDDRNLARLNRAVGHLVAALHSGAGPEETRKRAADVANQAFMFADPKRKRAALAESAR